MYGRKKNLNVSDILAAFDNDSDGDDSNDLEEVNGGNYGWDIVNDDDDENDNSITHSNEEKNENMLETSLYVIWKKL